MILNNLYFFHNLILTAFQTTLTCCFCLYITINCVHSTTVLLTHEELHVQLCVDVCECVARGNVDVLSL